MQQYLFSNLGDAGQINKPSIWQIANGNVACALTPDLGKAACIGGAKKDGIDTHLDADAVWEQFKGIYLSYRNEMVVRYINAQPGVLSQPDMDLLQSEKKQLVFASAKDIADQNRWTWWPLAVSDNPDTAALSAAALLKITQLGNADKCTGQVPFWKARLLQCEQLQSWLGKNNAADSIAVNNILTLILDSMVMVCHNSASPQMPFGYSTASAGTPKSFEEIVNHVFQQKGIATVADSNYFCNPYTIDFPKPYGKNPVLFETTTSTIDSCGCNRFAALKQEAASLGFDTSSLKSINRFLSVNYSDSLSMILWQGLQKCRSGLLIDTCSSVISGAGYPYDTAATISASKGIPCNGCSPQPPTCPIPVIDAVQYLNTTSSVNNIRINYSTGSAYTSCTLNISDSAAGYIKDITISPGSGQSITVSLPKCQKYRFTVSAERPGCDVSSPEVVLPALCTVCSPPAVISAVSYLNTSSFNNVQLTCVVNATSTNCRVVATSVSTGLKYTQPIAPGSSPVVLSVPACQGYLFRIFSGAAGNCPDSSNVFLLPACKTICKKVYAPILLSSFVVWPPFLNCDYHKPCISCNTLNALVAEFKSIYPRFAVPYTDSNTLSANQFEENSLLARFLNYRTGFSKNAIDYLRAIGQCSGGGTADALCSSSKPLTALDGILVADTVPCRAAQTQAAFIAQLIYQKRKEAIVARFDSLYRSTCLGAAYREQFYLTYQPKEYHYTLYYYDQAGNLVKTMPPAAVKPNYDAAYLSEVARARTLRTDVVNKFNNPLLSTNYRYNSLYQVMVQKTPDAGISKFWYDRLGRLVVSQNSRQAGSNYSYTLYDALGRITEVGQLSQATVITQAISRDNTALKSWINTGVKEQLTVTKYDEAYTPIAASTGASSGLYQQNLRNRVSYTYVKAAAGSDTNYPWDAATFYSYDIHGNVDTLLQDFMTGMGNIRCKDSIGGNRFKKIVYGYDLISGKVNDVAYQPGQPDRFYHLYNYDAENRLTEVKTSKDKIYWERDAAYEYYRHGPLARTVLGANQVQGLDYAYTLQGWLKGVNSTAVLSTSAGTSFDMGRDGIKLAANNNSLVARDAYGFSLNYFSGDYTALSSAVKPFAAIPAPLPADASNIATGRELFNGNIAAMAVNIPQLGKPIVYGYSYDQLNRLVRLDAFDGCLTAAICLLR